MKTDDVLKGITDKVIARLEAARNGKDFGPFESPWTGGDLFPKNFTTGDRYTGMNIFNLWITAMDKEWTSNEWCTVKQLFAYAKKHDLEVSFEGQKCTPAIRIVDFCPKDKDPSDDANWFKYTRVFWLLNRCQIEGLPEQEYEDPVTITRTDMTQFMENTGANIKYGGGRAFFRPKHDFIQLPPIDAFKSEEHFFGVAFHELTHWTGHEDRLNREQTMEKKGYAYEELVAEMGAALCCAMHQIPSKLNHAHYIDGYIKVLKDDFNALRQAATDAGKAYELLLTYQSNEKEEAA